MSGKGWDRGTILLAKHHPSLGTVISCGAPGYRTCSLDAERERKAHQNERLVGSSMLLLHFHFLDPGSLGPS